VPRLLAGIPESGMKLELLTILPNGDAIVMVDEEPVTLKLHKPIVLTPQQH
jgi:hypothetical protein